jgi:hypothetical protein
MTDFRDLEGSLERLIEKFGAKVVSDELHRLRSTKDLDCMTVIVNSGLHPLPSFLRRGEVYEVTSGNLDFTSEQNALSEIEVAIKQLIQKLAIKRPSKVYLLPWGPAALSCIVKHAIYRTIGVETVDILFIGEGRYLDIESPFRNLLTGDGLPKQEQP